MLYDTTHGTNKYEMKLGCVTGKDKHGRTILLGVSLVKHEDTRSFKWVFDQFFEAMGSEATVVFTDGDHAMAAAMSLFPHIQHFLCIFHMAKNLETHAERLFAQRKDKTAKELFIKMFKKLMYQGYPEATHTEEKFDMDWKAMLRVVHEVTPCPPDLEVDVGEDEVFLSCDEELDAEDDDAAVRAYEKRKRGRKKKSSTWLAWQWLKHQYAIKHKWARVFVNKHLTFSTFSTQRAESWHASLKQWQKVQKRLLQLCVLLERRRAEITGRNAVTAIKLKQLHDDRRHQHPAIINNLKGRYTPYAVEQMLKEHEASAPMLTREVDGEAAAAAGVTSDDRVVDGDVGDVKWFRVGVPGEMCPPVASTVGCSAGCPTNSGYPCAHMFACYAAQAMYEVHPSVIHPFYSLKEDEEIVEEEGEGEGVVSEGAMEGMEEEEGVGGLGREADFESVFRGFETVGSTPSERKKRSKSTTVAPAKAQRYGAIMGASKGLAALGYTSADACLMILQGLDDLYDAVSEKVTAQKNAQPTSAEVEVQNPSTVRKEAGRTATKRKRARGDEKKSGAKRKSGAK